MRSNWFVRVTKPCLLLYLQWEARFPDAALPTPKFSQWQRYLREQHGRGEHTRVPGSTIPTWFGRRDEILVRCPRCAARQRCAITGALREPTAPPGMRPAPAVVTSSTTRRADGRTGADHAQDYIFGHPLWLQARCCGGYVLSADNLENLDRIDRYLRARVRLGEGGVGYGPVPRQTSLPYWMMAASNQAELLAVIARLRATVTHS